VAAKKKLKDRSLVWRQLSSGFGQIESGIKIDHREEKK